MKSTKVTIVRIYIKESENLLNKIIEFLKTEIKIHGVSVFRAISGFGTTGNHPSSFIDLSLDLPLVVEFFDSKEKIEAALNYLNTIIKSEHIIFWEAHINN